MARKKTVTEPQEEQRQDAAVPMEDTSDGGAVPAMGNGTPEDGGPIGGGEFPTGADTPPDGALDGESPPQDAAPGEPPVQDGLPPGEAGDESGSGDYAAFLQAASDGVESVPPPEMPPLMLDNTGEDTDSDTESLPEEPGEYPPPVPKDSGEEDSPAPADKPVPTWDLCSDIQIPLRGGRNPMLYHQHNYPHLEHGLHREPVAPCGCVHE